MIWIITDTVAWAVYLIVYLPVVVITAMWCLGRKVAGKKRAGDGPAHTPR